MNYAEMKETMMVLRCENITLRLQNDALKDLVLYWSDLARQLEEQTRSRHPDDSFFE